MKKSISSALSYLAMALVLVSGSAAGGQEAGPKIKPADVSRTIDKKVLTIDPKLQPKIDPGKLDRAISTVSALESNLDRAFADFKKQHRETIRVARISVRKNRECNERIYDRGEVTEAERRAACYRSMEEHECLFAVYEHCQVRESADFRDSRAQLELKRERLEELLRQYEVGAQTYSQLELAR